MPHILVYHPQGLADYIKDYQNCQRGIQAHFGIDYVIFYMILNEFNSYIHIIINLYDWIIIVENYSNKIFEKILNT